jgi:hypothetical protein
MLYERASRQAPAMIYATGEWRVNLDAQEYIVIYIIRLGVTDRVARRRHTATSLFQTLILRWPVVLLTSLSAALCVDRGSMWRKTTPLAT